jgi:hypothetical protein
MMGTLFRIRRLLLGLAAREIFTTRDCLSQGPRTAVDQALCRLVRWGVIERLARGVFRKAAPDNGPVSPMSVAAAKAGAFGKRIVRHATDVAHKLGLIPAGNPIVIFAVSGHSSSFRFGDLVIQLMGICARKMRLGDDLPGSLARALWHLGPSACTDAMIAAAGSLLDGTATRQMHEVAALVPVWLGVRLDCFQCG